MERRTERTERLLLLVTWAAAAAWTLIHLDLGWFPADAGTLGQAAERVLGGELPHRDFQDPYTGGLAMLYAAAFDVMGPSVMSMRWVTYALFLLWVPAIWTLARRLTDPLTASLVTLLAATWTLPVYAEGMPSWYNLFLATFGALALLRFADTERTRWLAAAGVCGGLSILAKVVGLYFVAAGVLFVLWRTANRRLTLAATIAVAAGTAALVLRSMGPRHFGLYGVPVLLGLVPLAWTLVRRSGDAPEPTGKGQRAALALGAFLAGVMFPVALFLLPYAAGGSLADPLLGVLVRPAGRLQSVGMIGPAGRWWEAWPAVLLVAWVAAPAMKTRGEQVLAGVGTVALLAAAATSATQGVYVATFRALLWLSPVVVAGAALALVRNPRRRTETAVLLVALYGLVNLVQVPFAAPTYFFYAAPLGILVGLAALRAGAPTTRVRIALLALLTITALRFNHGFTLDIGFRYDPDGLSARLEVPRAMGLRVSPEDKADYEALVGALDRVGGATDPIWAGPDAPEVYFLAGRQNPTPTFFEVLDDPNGYEERVLGVIQRERVAAVVVRPSPLFSPSLSLELIQQLERRFPAGAQIGRFIVAWRP